MPLSDPRWFERLADKRRTTKSRSAAVAKFLATATEDAIKVFVHRLVEDTNPDGSANNLLNNSLEEVHELPEVVAHYFDYTADNAVEMFCWLGCSYRVAIISHLTANEELDTFAVQLLEDKKAVDEFVDCLSEQPSEDIKGIKRIVQRFAAEADDGQRLAFVNSFIDGGLEYGDNFGYTDWVWPYLVREDSDDVVLVFVVEHCRDSEDDSTVKAAKLLFERKPDTGTLVTLACSMISPYDELALGLIDEREQSQTETGHQPITVEDLEKIAQLNPPLEGLVQTMIDGLRAAEGAAVWTPPADTDDEDDR